MRFCGETIVALVVFDQQKILSRESRQTPAPNDNDKNPLTHLTVYLVMHAAMYFVIIG